MQGKTTTVPAWDRVAYLHQEWLDACETTQRFMESDQGDYRNAIAADAWRNHTKKLYDQWRAALAEMGLVRQGF